MKIYLPVNKISPKSIYLLYGYDSGLILDALQQIKANFLAAKKYYFTTVAQFLDFFTKEKYELFNQDLFSSSQVNKLLEININDGSFSKKQLKELDDFLRLLSSTDNLTVILIANKIDKNIENSRWFNYINNNGLILISKNLTIKQFKTWIAQEFNQINLNLTHSALSKFTQEFHNNLLAAKQNIYKLKLMVNSAAFQHITNKKLLEFADISTYIDLAEEKYSLFDLKYELQTKRSEEVPTILTIVDNLQQQGVEPILVLWAIIQALQDRTNRYMELDQIPSSLAKLWQQAAMIDMKIKEIEPIVDAVPHTYIWGLLQQLCLDYSEL